MQAASTGLKKAKREEILHAVDYVRWINLARPAGQGKERRLRVTQAPPEGVRSQIPVFRTRREVSAFATVVPHVSGLITRDRPPQYPEALTTSHDRRPTGTP